MFERRKLDLLAFEICVSILILFVMYALMISIVHFPSKSPRVKAEVQSLSSPPATKPAMPATDPRQPVTSTATPELAASATAAPSSPTQASAPAPKSNVASQQPTGNSLEYAVDAGLFRDPANAAGVVANLPAQFKPLARITPLRMRSGILYRVRIIVDDKDKAVALAQALLTQQKLQAVVTALP